MRESQRKMNMIAGMLVLAGCFNYLYAVVQNAQPVARKVRSQSAWSQEKHSKHASNLMAGQFDTQLAPHMSYDKRLGSKARPAIKTSAVRLAAEKSAAPLNITSKVKLATPRQ